MAKGVNIDEAVSFMLGTFRPPHRRGPLTTPEGRPLTVIEGALLALSEGWERPTPEVAELVTLIVDHHAAENDTGGWDPDEPPDSDVIREAVEDFVSWIVPAIGYPDLLRRRFNAWVDEWGSWMLAPIEYVEPRTPATTREELAAPYGRPLTEAEEQAELRRRAAARDRRVRAALACLEHVE